jgi:hypothetical protein
MIYNGVEFTLDDISFKIVKYGELTKKQNIRYGIRANISESLSINDYNIVKYLLDMSLMDYRWYLVDNFDGQGDIHGDVYFRCKSDARDALEWVQSNFIIKKLKKGK